MHQRRRLRKCQGKISGCNVIQAGVFDVVARRGGVIFAKLFGILPFSDGHYFQFAVAIQLAEAEVLRHGRFGATGQGAMGVSVVVPGV